MIDEALKAARYERNRLKKAAALAVETPEDREKRLAYQKLWKEVNREKHREGAKRWAKANPDRARENTRRHQATDAAKAKKSETSRALYAATIEAQRARGKAYREAHPEEAKARGAAWVAANRGRVNEKTGRRRASRVRATPKWLTKEQRLQMRIMYAAAAALGHHVDHIVPLKGQNVCGLHVPHNLQILPPEVNLSKGHKHA